MAPGGRCGRGEDISKRSTGRNGVQKKGRWASYAMLAGASSGGCPASPPWTRHRWAGRGYTEDPRGGPQRRGLAGGVCWDRNSEGSMRSGVGCQGLELRARRGRATEVVSCQEPQRLPTSSHPGHRAWLGSIFTHTLFPSPHPLPLEAVFAFPFSLTPTPARLGQGLPDTSAPAPLACLCLGHICL